jgi:type IV pilus assembly protein PilC
MNKKTTRKKFTWLSALNKQAIRPSTVALFSRQLATLINAGVPLVQALNIIIKSIDNKSFQQIISSMCNDIQSGVKFFEAASKFPQHFSVFFCSLVRIGEESGSLGSVLNHIATHQEKTESLKRKIKKALLYPSTIVVVALVVTAILLTQVVPQFQALFGSFNAALPPYTLFVINLSDFVMHYAITIVSIIILLILAFIAARRSSKKFRYLLDRWMIQIPIFGELIRKGIVARFSSTLATTFSAGMPLIDALKIVAKTADNHLYERKIMDIRDSISTGNSLHHSIEKTGLFAPMVTSMIAIGEETGKLDEMLQKINVIYEDEVDTMVTSLSSLIEPLVIGLIGILVGGLVIAMYLPIFKLGGIV